MAASCASPDEPLGEMLSALLGIAAATKEAERVFAADFQAAASCIQERRVDKQIGPYNIVRLIGAGGMGSVYEALHSQIQRRAAIKILHRDFQKDPEFLQRFFNEMRAMKSPSQISIFHELGNGAGNSRQQQPVINTLLSSRRAAERSVQRTKSANRAPLS